jgi:transposase InsO family protein
VRSSWWQARQIVVSPAVVRSASPSRRTAEILVTGNGPEFSGRALDTWAYARGVHLRFIRPGKPMENAFVESFNGKFRDECAHSTHRDHAVHAIVITRQQTARTLRTEACTRKRGVPAPASRTLSPNEILSLRGLCLVQLRRESMAPHPDRRRLEAVRL